METGRNRRGEKNVNVSVRTGYYTFLKTHFHHAGAHQLNEVILVFLILLIINYLDVNCFAVDGKISIISKEQSGRQASQEKKQEEEETVKGPERSKFAPIPQELGRRRLPRSPPRLTVLFLGFLCLRGMARLDDCKEHRLYSQRFWVLILDVLCEIWTDNLTSIQTG